MRETINPDTLKQIVSHRRRFGVKYWANGLGYERCAELSWVINHLASRFRQELRYLDIGTGESPLPTFLYMNTKWDITCVDKCPWVRKQHGFLRLVNGAAPSANRFQVIEADLLEADLPAESFDLITSVSVIEHFEGGSDSEAMKATARLLRPGGRLILTTLINEPFFAEFYLNQMVYGVKYEGSPVFYQRHYDVKSIAERLIKPSGLVEKDRLYFGDYGFQCFETLLQWPKPLLLLYAWNKPWLAKTFLSYRSYPVSRKNMRMNTASGLILVLERPLRSPDEAHCTCAESWEQ
jgi:SAM-dependent methyltransferase